MATIPRSEENYAVVKRVLCDAYNRSDRLLWNLTNKLKALPIPKNKSSDLKTFHIILESVCCQLGGTGNDVNCLYTRYAVQKQLPLSLLQRWTGTSGVHENMWTKNFPA